VTRYTGPGLPFDPGSGARSRPAGRPGSRPAPRPEARSGHDFGPRRPVPGSHGLASNMWDAVAIAAPGRPPVPRGRSRARRAPGAGTPARYAHPPV